MEIILFGSNSQEASASEQVETVFQDDSYFTGGLDSGLERESLENIAAILTKTDSSVRKEERAVARSSKIACDVCGQVVSKLRDHMIRKHPESLESVKVPEYRCEACDYTTRIKSSLRQHVNNLHTERSLRCEQCSYRTAVPAQMRQHMKKVHSPPTISCPVPGCQRKFVQSCDIKDHVKRVHPTGFFNCHMCGKQFVNEEKLKRHIKMHNIDQEGLPCQHCHLKFLTRQKLAEHTNTHTGETPYRCPVEDCGKAFMSSSSLSHHKKICSAGK